MKALSTTLLCTLFAAALIPACATDEPVDELAGESDQDGEAGKGDTVDAFTYFTIGPDGLTCDEPRCQGFYVERANRSLMNCSRGVTARSCHISALDFSKTGMPESVAKSYEDRINSGEAIVLRGDLLADPLDRGTLLGVTEVWVPANPSTEVEGVFVLVKNRGVRCATAPCPPFSEIKLNANRLAAIDSIDLESSGADQDLVDRAMDETYGGAGVIIAGYRTNPTRDTKARVASQFWTKAPTPLH